MLIFYFVDLDVDLMLVLIKNCLPIAGPYQALKV